MKYIIYAKVNKMHTYNLKIIKSIYIHIATVKVKE